MRGTRFVPELRQLQPAALAETLRQSLVAIPGLCLFLGVAMAEATIRLDRSSGSAWLPDSYRTTSVNARVVLGAIATGTITVVTLVLTLTLVAIQLAAGQLSPRTIANFLGDRFQQLTVGVVLGTATFSLLALRSVRVASDGDVGRQPDATVLMAVLLTVVSLIMLVLSVDRTASRLAVGTLLNDLAAETCALVTDQYGCGERGIEPELPGAVVSLPDDDDRWNDSWSVSADRAGWVQFIDEDAMIAALPDGADARLRHPVGTFVLPGMELIEVDSAELDDDSARSLRAAIVVGDRRTMQQDVGYGLTRLTDIGLRALSPGVNDPNTAREVVLRLAQVVFALQSHSLPGSARAQDGKSIQRLEVPTHDDFVADAFDQVRRAADGDQATLVTLDRTLEILMTECRRQNLPGSTAELENQHRLVRAALAELPEWSGRDTGATQPRSLH